jgi:hypothetical protein
VEDLPFRLGQLLGSKKLAQMAAAARALGRPAAAADICRAVTERLAARPAPMCLGFGTITTRKSSA